MRLPWPFRSARPGRGSSAAGSSDADRSSADHASAAGSETGRPSRGAWQDLPALNETVGPPPLVAPARPFAESLTSENPPPPILAPLSHGRGLEAPAGLVSGLAHAVAVRPGAPTPAPVQRSPIRRRSSGAGGPVEDVAGPVAGSVPDAAPSDDMAAELPALAATAAAATTRPAASSPDAAASGLRRLATGPAASRPILDLTRASIDLPLVRGVVGPSLMGEASRPLSAAPAASAAAATAPAAATSTVAPSITAAQRAPQLEASDGPAATAPSVTRGSAAAAAPAADRSGAGPERMTLGQTRRLGLGAPLGGIARGAVPLGSVATPPAGALLESTQRAPREASASLPSASRTGPPPAARLVAQLAPIAPAVAAARGTARAPVRLASVQRSPVAPATVPIIAARPLETRVQRAPLTAAAPATTGTEPEEPVDGGAVGPTTLATESGPVTVHRGADAASLSSALDARSFTHGGEIYLPASHGSISSGQGRSLLAHELTHVAQQRRLGSSLPTESSPRGQTLEADAVAAERSASLPLALPPTHRPDAGDSQAGLAQPGTTTSTATPPVLPGSTGEPATPRRTAEVQRAPTAAGEAAPPGPPVHESKRTERELDDLARQLYARIGRRLRRDLLVDRERAGIAVDVP
jgi:Domain of unknown function (DUF4157)